MERCRAMGLAPRIGPRTLARRHAGRMTLRVPVPAEILALVGVGNAHPEVLRPGFWDLVAARMQTFVDAQLPEGAADLHVVLDERRLEVVLSFRVASDADVR